jgi:uncharacterized sodium:solute symporter family permease YidK
VVVALVFIKPYYDLRVVSIYEFLRVRFGERTKNGASAVFLITRALASGTRLYVAAVVLVLGYEMFSGVALAPLQQVWIYIGSLVFLTAATSIYTALGASRRSSGRTSSRQQSCSVRLHLRFGRCFRRSRAAGRGRWPYSTLPKT